jgi:transcriptional regulator
MLIRSHDAARDEAEWRTFLTQHDFGQLIATGAGRPVPIVVPTHFVFDGQDGVELHLTSDNPVWDAVAEQPLVVLSVVGAYAFIPGYWAPADPAAPEYGIPTSYYGAVQATCRASRVDDPAQLAAILERQLAHFQPEGRHATVAPGQTNPFGRRLGAIRGLRLAIEDVRAKFKFGGNRPAADRLRIADHLLQRGGPLDLEARSELLRRLHA